MNRSWRDLLPLDDSQLLKLCKMSTLRRPGPGGQKKNVTDSAVRLRLTVENIEATAGESRSQHTNRANALNRMRLEIALRLRATVEDDFMSNLESLDYMTSNAKNKDYPEIIAVIFDYLAENNWDPRLLGKEMNIGQKAVLKIIEKDRRAIRALTEAKQTSSLRHSRK